MRLASFLVVTAAFLPAFFLSGCATTGESAGADNLTSHVGIYSPPPPSLRMVRVGIPPFLDARKGQKARASMQNLGAIAADQLTTLAVNTGRFDVIERAQLEQLLKEQGLEGIVDPKEMARQGKVRGVDYLIIGKVTNFRVQAAKSRTGLGIAQLGLGKLGGVGAFDLKKSNSRITVDCGVDLRLVDPSTGSTLAAQFGEYKKTNTLNAFGIQVLGINATADGRLQVDEDNQGKILRLALDHALRRMLPMVDRRLLQAQRQKASRQKK